MRFRPSNLRRSSLILVFGLAAVVVAATALTLVRYARLPGHEEGVTRRPVEVAKEGYVSSRTCESCHPWQYETWHASYHRTMTQVVTPESVATDLDGVELAWGGRSYRIERRGDDYWVVERIGADTVAERRIAMSTGSHAMQLYWLESNVEGRGRVMDILPFHYLIEDARWIPRAASFLTPPGGESFGTQWNTGCINCHATKGEPRAGDQMADTHVGEFGIACEACHGPGEAHVVANRNPLRRYQLHLGEEDDPDIVNPSTLPKQRSAEVCGRCHGYGGPADANRREFFWSGYKFKPGEDLSQSRNILRRADFGPGTPATWKGMFWEDGMVRGSGREFGGLLESPCFQRGEMSCLSCHTMHPDREDPRPLGHWANDQLKPDMDGNAACAECHPSLVANVEAHSHHPPESAGSNCYNCHMSYTTYGLLKAIRSHEIESPSVATTLATGRPNACNQCHLDQSLGWAADRMHEWYGTPKPELGAQQQTVAASVLDALSGDASQRALAAWSMGWKEARKASGSDWMVPYLAQLLEDPYPAVRFIAHRSLTRLPGFADFGYDFLDEESHAQARARALETWRRTPAEADPATLMAAGGEPEWELFRRLLAQRDDRAVIVVE